ncbi:MAG: hypothetical protein K1X88_22635 [Nannocystaceae bacterium]|nr:hypothetical protein [Nannocystaceae bacterium]
MDLPSTGTHAEPPTLLRRALGLREALDEAWSWAIAPLEQADEVAARLVELARRRDLPYAGLRMLTQAALGDEVRAAAVDRWLESDPEVLALLAVVRHVGRDLEGVQARARAASRRAMAIALEAPALARQAAAAVWAQGPQPGRDATLQALEALPRELKAHADRVRAEASLAPQRADAARRRIVEGLRARARAAGLQRTDRLCPVG